MFLSSLNQRVTSIKGVGPALADNLAGLNIKTVGDLLVHLPRAYQDRRKRVALHSADENKPVNTVVEVVSSRFTGSNGSLLEVRVKDRRGEAFLLCFGRSFLKHTFKPGTTFFIYGTFKKKYNKLSCSQFDYELYTDRPKRFKRILPIYPLSGTLTQHSLRSAIEQALDQYHRYIRIDFTEKITTLVYQALECPHPLDKDDLNAVQTSLTQQLEIHLPQLLLNTKTSENTLFYHIHKPNTLTEAQQGRRVLALMELFFSQIKIDISITKRKMKHKVRDPAPVIKGLYETCLESLPFALTSDQQKALQDISHDLQQPYPMARLLHGEVGSGKTVVALLSAAMAVEQGVQVALMAPTEVLARQLAEQGESLLAVLKINIALLTGGIEIKQRKLLLQKTAADEVDILVGTHALFTRDVAFSKLGLVIVDEQHKFGVLQRLALVHKGENPDLLLMTATPIPRTLADTLYGSLSLSTLSSVPADRSPPLTHLTCEGNEEKVYRAVEQEMNNDAQLFCVAPRINDSVDTPWGVETIEKSLKKRFPQYSLGVIHSKTDQPQISRIIQDFREGKIKILCATTIIEVGLDIPKACCMIVYGAHMFGLSTLHQLRGRIGRGKKQGRFFLIYPKNMTEEATERIKAIKNTYNGFLIAEMDMKLRGSGEQEGIKQSGFTKFSLARFPEDFDLLKEAQQAGQGFIQDCIIKKGVFNAHNRR